MPSRQGISTHIGPRSAGKPLISVVSGSTYIGASEAARSSLASSSIRGTSPDASRKIKVELAIGEGLTSAQQTLFGDRTRVLEREGGARLERFALEVDGALLLSMSVRAGGLLRLDRLDHSHPVFGELFRALLTRVTTIQEVRDEDSVTLDEMLDALVSSVAARRRGLFPRIEEESEGSEVDGETWAFRRKERCRNGRGRGIYAQVQLGCDFH